MRRYWGWSLMGTADCDGANRRIVAIAVGRGERTPNPGHEKGGAARLRRGAARESGEVLRRELPVHQVPDRFQVRRASVAVIDGVGVYPHVHGEQRLVA